MADFFVALFDDTGIGELTSYGYVVITGAPNEAAALDAANDHMQTWLNARGLFDVEITQTLSQAIGEGFNVEVEFTRILSNWVDRSGCRVTLARVGNLSPIAYEV